MNFTLDTGTIVQGIQLAVAPVFFLTAVSGMVGVVAGRLARIVDRARVLEERAMDSRDAAFLQRTTTELSQLQLRGQLSNGAIVLLTLCALLIGLTIIVLFLGETMGLQSARLGVFGFLSGVASFLLALLCFMWETVLATRMLQLTLLITKDE
ncbi:MAG: DUF2721 domain-containing protein [Giesbergeria sp.]|nr:DUF2721 domain-containing protein [Giesbergeria sp.]